MTKVLSCSSCRPEPGNQQVGHLGVGPCAVRRRRVYPEKHRFVDYAQTSEEGKMQSAERKCNNESWWVAMLVFQRLQPLLFRSVLLFVKTEIDRNLLVHPKPCVRADVQQIVHCRPESLVILSTLSAIAGSGLAGVVFRWTIISNPDLILHLDPRSKLETSNVKDALQGPGDHPRTCLGS